MKILFSYPQKTRLTPRIDSRGALSQPSVQLNSGDIPLHSHKAAIPRSTGFDREAQTASVSNAVLRRCP
jgi:hypothetical protein